MGDGIHIRRAQNRDIKGIDRVGQSCLMAESRETADIITLHPIRIQLLHLCVDVNQIILHNVLFPFREYVQQCKQWGAIPVDVDIGENSHCVQGRIQQYGIRMKIAGKLELIKEVIKSVLRVPLSSSCRL